MATSWLSALRHGISDRNLAKHESTFVAIRDPLCLITNGQALLSAEAFSVSEGRVKWSVGASEGMLKALGGAQERPPERKLSERPQGSTSEAAYSKRERARQELAAVGAYVTHGNLRGR